MLHGTKKFFEDNFDMKEFCEVSFILGIEIHRYQIGRILQLKYLKRFDMQDYKPCNTRFDMQDYKPCNTSVVKRDTFCFNECSKIFL